MLHHMVGSRLSSPHVLLVFSNFLFVITGGPVLRIRAEATKPMGYTNLGMGGRKQLYLYSCVFVIFIWSLVVIVSL